MTTILSIIFALIVLSVLVVFHEAGHFTAGKLLGFKIQEFSVGFGPRFGKIKKNDTEYSLRALPLGGYCKFLGEEEHSDEKGAFNNQPVWKRMIVILAGPFMNFVLAILLAIIILFAYGDYFPSTSIGAITANTPAQKAGLKAGDKIIEINNSKISAYSDVTNLIKSNKDKLLHIKINRNSDIKEFDIKPYYDSSTKSSRIGIELALQRERFSFADSVRYSFKWTEYIMQKMVEFLGALFFRGQGAGDIMGPVGTIGLIGQAVRQGFENILRLGFLISINLGIVNLIPFPALDGGRFVFLLYEGIKRKPLNHEKEGIIDFAGLVVLMLLMLFLTYKDIIRGVSSGWK